MKVARKFHLDRIGHRYETIVIEVEAENIQEAVQKIEESWRYYCKEIVDGRVK